MNKKHKHAELIKAWADGAEIEWKDREDRWQLFNSGGAWLDSVEYRIKLEPKPDVNRFNMHLNLILTLEKDGPLVRIIEAEVLK